METKYEIIVKFKDKTLGVFRYDCINYFARKEFFEIRYIENNERILLIPYDAVNEINIRILEDGN